MSGARGLMRGALTLALVGAAEAVTLACPICFQTTDGSAATGVRAAVLVLMGVTTAVLAGFAWFAAGFVRRSRSADPAAVGGRMPSEERRR